MAKSNEKHSHELLVLTEDNSDLLNGIVNNLFLMFSEIDNGDLAKSFEGIKTLRNLIMSKRFDDLHNALSKSRHEAGFCKDPNCKSKIKVREYN